MTFEILSGDYALCRLQPEDNVPRGIKKSAFYTISKSRDELSIVCEQKFIPAKITTVDKDWKLLRITGTLDLTLTGITAKFSAPLAEVGVNICVIATYDTDYLMVKAEKLMMAVEALRKAAFFVKHQV